ncbi:hypothetical protein SAMN05421543_11187 [Alicyclobacillus macrosporangiidus]|jgi:hypothetical protein|uniref:Uncharacterized protein n=1 Tax=Alicyclobacillus macrosporangiidus TaxID=392015 RepID=A0A1I7JRX4_9BACL|nr:hypothetical protein SAMN05421543_11187 [Alicyclobacillus macrosporangiidus]
MKGTGDGRGSAAEGSGGGRRVSEANKAPTALGSARPVWLAPHGAYLGTARLCTTGHIVICVGMGEWVANGV